jgi:hypothetical protein
MGAWMILALAPGLALCCAAVLAEQAAHQRRWPSRWIWLAAMAGSILLPMLGPAIPELAPLRMPAAPSSWPAAVAGPARLVVAVQAQGTLLARGAWISLSAATLLLLTAAALLLRLRARGWRRLLLDGSEVYVAPDAGPAVFGWWQPRIVLPAWLAEAPGRQRDLAIAHEQSHLAAGDPQLLGLAIALTVLMPWNPSLWWQLRRLRDAIEVDCDARVLRRGCDLLDYGETLLALGQRRSPLRGLMAASDQSQSLLERRIRIMSSQPRHWSRLTACTLAGLALCVAAVAAELAPARAPVAAVAPAPPVPAVPAAPAVPAVPAAPAVPAVAPVPPAPPLASVAPPAPDASDSDESDSDAATDAMMAAGQAAERAAELKSDAEADAEAAQEAKRDAEEQLAQAKEAMREAEAAAAEAEQRKLEAEAAERAAQPLKPAG